MGENWPFKRHWKASIRFGIVAAVIYALFWGLMTMRYGPVPVIHMTPTGWGENPLVVTIAYSRWLDVPLTFGFIVIYWMLFALISKRWAKAGSEENIVKAIFAGLVIGVAAGMFALSAPHLPTALALAAVVIGTASVLTFPVYGVAVGLTFALITNAASGAFISTSAGVGPGMVLGLICFAGSLATIGLGIILKMVFYDVLIQKGYLDRCWDWLTAAG